ncbi:MAG: Na/Pi cotransporter family protein [Spirochaetaceae bacterium]|nr:Na/Pi cotransporter family protein [Spirochaetaceae bacterium]
MKGFLQLINLIGGVGVFLVGMRIMSDGIQNRAGNKLKSALHTMTENRFAGVLTGAGITSIIQSSSATTVLLVSLVNAGLITVKQSLGVIMGANIGTTLTAWIVSTLGFKFHIADVALPAIAIAIPFYFSGRSKRREIADILIGFGLLFLGLSFMKDAVPDIKNNPEVLAFLSNWSQMGFASTMLFVLIGTLLTVIVQSSSAAMTITITMAFKGWIDFPVAAAVILGENIGTTITAFLASIPMNATAKRTSRAHMLFNLIGVVWMLAVFNPFIRLVDAVVPGSASDPVNIPFHLSMFHTLFNIFNTILLIGFIGPMSRLVEKMVKDDTVGSLKTPYQLKVVPWNLADSVASNLITVRHDLAVMAGEAYTMLNMVLGNARNQKELEKSQDEMVLREQRVDDMQEQIIGYLTSSTQHALGHDQSKTVTAQQRIANELESVADSSFSISLLLNKLYDKGWKFHEQGDNEIRTYTEQVLNFIKYNQDFLDNEVDEYDVNVAREMERGIDSMRDKLRKRSRRTIERDEEVNVKGELIFMDIVKHLEHIGDNSMNVSEAIVAMPGI